jgi:membrane fusion protein, multidrug efflux system
MGSLPLRARAKFAAGVAPTRWIIVRDREDDINSGAAAVFQLIAFALTAPMQQLTSLSGKSRRFSLAVATIAAFDLAGCGSKNAYVPPPPAKVVVAQPLQKPVTLYLELTGNTAPFNSVNLVARVQGYLESIDYKDGATVTKGTQLFGIERDLYQAALDQANGQLAHDQAALDEAEINLSRYQTLERQNSIAAQQAQDQAAVVQQNKGTVLVDKANVDTATINLGFTRVLAPFDGVVTNHQVDIGTYVGAAGPTTLATIVQPDPLYAYFTASEPQILALRRNLAKRGESLRTTNLSDIPVEIGLQDEEGYPHKGHMDYVAPQVDTSTGTLTGRALFENKDHALLPGLFVRVRIPIARQDKALLTRDDAIGTSQEGSYVLVVGTDNVVQRRIVKTGPREGQLRVIESGLDPGDWVVTEGVQRAFPGAKVEPQRSELTSAAADPSDAVKSDAAKSVPDPASK